MRVSERYLGDTGKLRECIRKGDEGVIWVDTGGIDVLPMAADRQTAEGGQYVRMCIDYFDVLHIRPGRTRDEPVPCEEMRPTPRSSE
ncbi:hypothetical protein TRAPUB_8537 [Trametes pubescens]|uniref:Uncharacterized protein n=1 Tax=Trametes pubescens TaxID=154538 RepID=A0A1M2W4W6_TRAPU|nr:hypothetical protein TRAPUB_8537 [Trametes pubescens]